MRTAVVGAIVALLLCCGCGSEAYVDMQSVDAYHWSDPVSIVYDNSDITTPKDIAVALRYNDSFDSDTLTVVIQTSLPDVHQTRERMLLRLNRDYKATALTLSECVGYRDNCLLNQSGYYIFTITPCRTVRGIEAVGIEIAE